jgi:hypothetical protein
MVPQKWTSPEQDEWLAPWYDKYCTKQTEKKIKTGQTFLPT